MYSPKVHNNVKFYSLLRSALAMVRGALVYLLSVSALLLMLIPTANAQFQQHLDFKSGRVLARSVVINPDTGLPFLVEFDQTGNEVREVDLGSVSVADVQVVSAADYRFFQQQLADFQSSNADNLAVGSEILSRTEYEERTFLLADNTTILEQTPLAEGVNSVLVRGQGNRLISPAPGAATNAYLSLLRFTFDLTQQITLEDASVSLVVNRDGQILAQSANTIGFRTGFFGDPNEPQENRRTIVREDDTVFGPVPFVKVNVDEFAFPGSVGVTGEDGRYSFQFLLPICPLGGFTFTTDVWAELRYRNFLPTGAPTIPYYLRTPGSSTCFAGFTGSVFSPSITSELIVSNRQSNLFVDVSFLGGTLVVRNINGEDVPVGDTTYTTFEQAAEQTTQNFYDFNGDGQADHVVQGRILECIDIAPGPLDPEPEPVAAFLPFPSDSEEVDLDDLVEDFSCTEPNPIEPTAETDGGAWQGLFFDGVQDDIFDYPDLVRVIDRELRNEPIGVLQSISREDLRNTDILIFRESTGQLILERRGLKRSEAQYRRAVEFDGEDNEVAYRILFRGARDSNFNIGGGINRSASFNEWATDYQLSEPFQNRRADHPRPGEFIKIVAINRATGYIGTARVLLESSSQNGASLLDTVVPTITMRPPNLKVWAEREYEVASGVTEGEEREFTIGNEGSSLTSDTTITVFTDWLDERGQPLPDELGLDDGAQYGLTGRLARVVGQNQLRGAGQSDDMAEFPIGPGRSTQALRIRNDGANAGAEHFYVHVIGKPREQECVADASCPSFDVASLQPGLEGRPSLLTPFLTPLFDENTSQLQALAFGQVNAAFENQDQGESSEDTIPQEPLPSYVWQYRPEYQFSQFELEINEINRNFTNQEDEIESASILEDGANAISDTDDSLELLLDVIVNGVDPLTPIDGAGELVISVGGQEQLLGDGAEQTITFDDVPSLNNASSGDLIAINIINNADAGNVLAEHLTEFAQTIGVNRTTSLGRYNAAASNNGLSDITDSFQNLSIRVRSASLVSVEVLDENLDSVGIVLPIQALEAGNYGVIITYEDIVAHIEDGDTYYLAVNQVVQSTGDDVRDLYTGVLESRITNQMLGQVIEHDTLIQRGALTLRREDMLLSGLGPQLNFIRSYTNDNELGRDRGGLGAGWSHNHDIYAQVVAEADEQGFYGNNLPVWTQRLRDEDGELPRIFTEDEVEEVEERPIMISVTGGGTFRFVDGTWHAPRGYHGSLEFVAERYVYTSKDGTRYIFANPPVELADEDQPRFYVSRIEDRNGNALTYEYASEVEGRHLVRKVTDATGRSMQFNYQIEDLIAPRLISVNSTVGINLEFSYGEVDDGDENIGPLLNRFARDNFIESYRYERNDGENDPVPNLVSTTDPRGNTTSYEYLAPNDFPSGLDDPTLAISPFNLVSSITYPGNTGVSQIAYLNAGQRSRTVTDLRGNNTVYRLNQFGNPTEIIEPLNRTTRYTWTIDQGIDDNQIVQKTDALGRITTYQYDPQGNVSRMVDPIGTVTQSWDQQYSLLLERNDRNGNTIRNRYDSSGNLVSNVDEEGFSTANTYNQLGQLITTRRPDNGGVISYGYDGFGNQNQMVLAEGSSYFYVNDNRGRRTRSEDANGNVSSFQYDQLDRPTITTHPDGFTSEYQYDAKGNKISERDKLGLTLSYEYDARDRVQSVTRSFGGGQMSYSYDNNANVLSETDWLGQVTSHVYDPLNRRIQSTNRIGDDMTMAYDLVDNLLSESDYLGQITAHEYDVGDRRTRTTNRINDVMIYEYDRENNVTSMTDYEGRITRYAYDRRYLQTVRTNPFGDTYQTQYDGRRNPTVMIDELGRRSRYEYDRQDRKVREVDALNFVMEYEYDGNSNVVEMVDRRGFTTRHSYDEIDRVETTTDREGFVMRYVYDANNNRTEYSDGNGHDTRSDYDVLNRMIREVTPVNGTTTYTYDANSNVTSRNDAIGTEYEYDYDALDRVVLERHAGGLPVRRTQTTTYDANSNVLSQTNFRNFTTRFSYDGLDRLQTRTDALGQITRLTYDGVDNKLSETNRRGFTTNFQYDVLDRLTLTTDALAQTVANTYDPVGNILQVRDKRGTITSNTFDDLDRLIDSTKPDVEGNNIRLFFNEYDREDNITAISDANGNRTQYEYDGRGLQITTVNPDNTRIVNTYDGVGLPLTMTDEIGQVTRYTYDDDNRKITATNFANETTRYEYDLNDNQTLMIQPEGNTQAYVYDALNRVEQITDGENNVTRYTYDGNNNQVSHNDANGNLVNYEYDALDRRIRHNQPNGLVSSFSYDPEDNMVGRVDPNGQSFSYEFDAIDRETVKTFPDVSSPFMRIQSIVSDYDGNNHIVRTTETKFNALENGTVTDICLKEYDLLDRQVANNQRGHQINYVYDDNGNRLRVTSEGGDTSYTYDNRNRLTTATTGNGTSRYTYTGDSKQERVTYPNATVTRYNYDDADRVLSVFNEQVNQQGNVIGLISSFAYTYDDNSNRIRQVETQGGFSQNQVQTTNYVYDNTNRMTQYAIIDQQSGGIQTLAYTFDANYNRTREIESQTVGSQTTVVKDRTSAYDGNNRITRITDNLDPESDQIIYAYDNNGNTLTKTDNTLANPELTTFFYDSRNQLAQIIRGPPGSQANQGFYDYDYGGMRIRHLASERGEVEYIYDGKSILEERTIDSDQLIAHYRYSDRLLSLNTDSDEQYYHYSALRTTANLTNTLGAIQASYRTDVWGHITDQSGSSQNRQVFTGQEHDENTGLIYFGARYYDPDTARFINEDTYLGESTTPPSLHRYLYAYANPTVYIDRDGNAAYFATAQEIDDIGFQFYQEERYVLAAVAATGGAAYKMANAFFTGGLADRANVAVTENDTFSDAGKQFGNELKDVVEESAEQFVKEGVIEGTARLGAKVACGRARGVCDKAMEIADKASDKLNADVKDLSGKKSKDANAEPSMTNEKAGSGKDGNTQDGGQKESADTKLRDSSNGDVPKNQDKFEIKDKPKHAPNVKKWEAKGGSVKKNPDGSVTYKDWDGNEVTYRDSVADFKEGGHVKAEVEIEDMKGDHYHDYKKANKEAGYGEGAYDNPEGTTWHHKDCKTMQCVDTEVHDRFSHKGGVSDLKKDE